VRKNHEVNRPLPYVRVGIRVACVDTLEILVRWLRIQVRVTRANGRASHLLERVIQVFFACFATHLGPRYVE
jgi:hypothetical protein